MLSGELQTKWAKILVELRPGYGGKFSDWKWRWRVCWYGPTRPNSVRRKHHEGVRIGTLLRAKPSKDGVAEPRG